MIQINQEDLIFKVSTGGTARVRITHRPSGLSGDGYHPWSELKARDLALADLQAALDAAETREREVGLAVHTKGEASHDSDIDFSVWLGTDFKDHQLDHIATIEGFLRAAYRAGWKAGREAMIQNAMEGGE